MFSQARSGADRLAAWRNFRRSFPRTGTPQHVVDAFASVPRENRYLDYYTPESWPRAFEIVETGMFCQTGLTLVITATLSYLNFIKTPDVHLCVISNHITGTEGLVLQHEDNFYNFLPGKIVSRDFVQENSTRFDSYIIAVDKLHG